MRMKSLGRLVLLPAILLFLPRAALGAAPGDPPPEPAAESPVDGNRLAYLDAPCDPYYPHRGLARLATPQWVGEPGVDAVVVLSIDDLRSDGAARYEAFLRPILDRLKRLDGRAPVSIMTNHVDPADSQVKAWFAEGLSIEAHTHTHPCPLLQGGELAAAKRSFDQCVDLLQRIPGARPVCFRMPCCDSMNSVSPRFFTEIFGKTTPAGNFLEMDSSVFVVFTAADPELPRELVVEPDGRERFRKYIPQDRRLVNFVEDYPYPWVIDRCCWEIPILMPSDWDAQHLNGKCSPRSVADYKAAIDAVVVKQGIFALCFYPHGWIANDQIVELIDYAAEKHAGKVKFLTFREVCDRLTKNLLAGQPLRANDGGDNGVRVLDLDNDGFMEAAPSAEVAKWTSPTAAAPLPDELRPFHKPDRDAGLRFIDLDEDGRLDLVFSNHERYGVWLFASKEEGWRCVLSGKRGEKDPEDELPMIVRADGTNNGAWFKDRYLWVQNEDTGAKLPHHVDSRSFRWMLRGEPEPPARSPGCPSSAAWGPTPRDTSTTSSRTNKRSN